MAVRLFLKVPFRPRTLMARLPLLLLLLLASRTGAVYFDCEEDTMGDYYYFRAQTELHKGSYIDKCYASEINAVFNAKLKGCNGNGSLFAQDSSDCKATIRKINEDARYNGPKISCDETYSSHSSIIKPWLHYDNEAECEKGVQKIEGILNALHTTTSTTSSSSSSSITTTTITTITTTTTTTITTITTTIIAKPTSTTALKTPSTTATTTTRTTTAATTATTTLVLCPDGGGLALTPDLYLQGYDAYKTAVCIPDRAFCQTQQYCPDNPTLLFNVTLENMLQLVYVGQHAFHSFQGKISIKGSFPKLKEIRDDAFDGSGTSDSSIFLDGGNLSSFEKVGNRTLDGATTSDLETIGQFAFRFFKGAVKFAGEFPNLKVIGEGAFEGAGNANNVVAIQCRSESWTWGKRPFSGYNGTHDPAGEMCSCSTGCPRTMSTTSTTPYIGTPALECYLGDISQIFFLSDPSKCWKAEINAAFNAKLDGCDGHDLHLLYAYRTFCQMTVDSINSDPRYIGADISCGGASRGELKWDNEADCRKGAASINRILECQSGAGCSNRGTCNHKENVDCTCNNTDAGNGWSGKSCQLCNGVESQLNRTTCFSTTSTTTTGSTATTASTTTSTTTATVPSTTTTAAITSSPSFASTSSLPSSSSTRTDASTSSSTRSTSTTPTAPTPDPLSNGDGSVPIAMYGGIGGGLLCLLLCIAVVFKARKQNVRRLLSRYNDDEDDHHDDIQLLDLESSAPSISPTPKKTPASRKEKFIAPVIRLGRATQAAHGLADLMGYDSISIVQHIMTTGGGIAAIKNEVMLNGNAEDKTNMKGLIDGTYVNPDNDDETSAEELAAQKKTIDELMKTDQVKTAKLTRAHVLALRLYTTSTYSSVNQPLRTNPPTKPHPFAVTTFYISEGIKLLRAVAGELPGAHQPQDLWRGLKDLTISTAFLESGGTEFACMSTSLKEGTAIDFAKDSRAPMIIKLETKDFMSRGADISFLSVYPGESETLFPPLTFLRPIDNGTKTVVKEGKSYLVVRCEPVIP